MKVVFTFCVVFVLIFGSLALPLSSVHAEPNGCGPSYLPQVPDYYLFYGDVFPFVYACNNHDICYAAGVESRYTCDARFLSDLLGVCRAFSSWWMSRAACTSVAYVYYGAVRAFGGLPL
jgi:hypothetical protein